MLSDITTDTNVLKYVKNSCDETGIELKDSNQAKIRDLTNLITTMVTVKDRSLFEKSFKEFTTKGYKSKVLSKVYNLVRRRYALQLQQAKNPKKAATLNNNIAQTKNLGFAVENVINDLIFGYDDYDDYLF